MEENYGLTKEQKDYLKTLICQRVREDAVNEELIKNFENAENPGIAAALQNSWREDKKNKVAYYIVKDPELDMPLLFFSLRCGEVADPFDPKRIEEIRKNSEMLLAAATGHDAEDWAKAVIEKMKESGIAPEKIEKEFRNRYARNVSRQRRYANEATVEGENIVRVLESHAAVELVHFCAYDPIGRLSHINCPKEQKKQFRLMHNPALRRWKAMGMDAQSIGKTMFWQFIVPIIQDVRKILGCEYIYLFAADSIQYGELVQYYEKLGFEVRKDLSVSKQEYDFNCYFMCQKVTSLRNRKREFFKNYNKPRD